MKTPLLLTFLLMCGCGDMADGRSADASAPLSICQRASDAMIACGVVDGPASPCLLNNCQAGCVLRATCPEIVEVFSGQTPSPSNAFFSCWTACYTPA